MIIKKYQAKTEAEALENAKKELGQGIVLMNVRPVKPKGLFSFLKSPVTEITVALEEEPEQPKTDRRETAQTIAFHSAVSEAAQAVTGNPGVHRRTVPTAGIRKRLKSVSTISVP